MVKTILRTLEVLRKPPNIMFAELFEMFGELFELFGELVDLFELFAELFELFGELFGELFELFWELFGSFWELFGCYWLLLGLFWENYRRHSSTLCGGQHCLSLPPLVRASPLLSGWQVGGSMPRVRGMT